jgi:FMN phosphatase YigB (HAD superfamily)
VVDALFSSLPELDALFRGKVCGDEVALGKPSPEIYQKAAKLAGFPPRECSAWRILPAVLQVHPPVGRFVVMVPD